LRTAGYFSIPLETKQETRILHFVPKPKHLESGTESPLAAKRDGGMCQKRRSEKQAEMFSHGVTIQRKVSTL
jgi:hypothetical protein